MRTEPIRLQPQPSPQTPVLEQYPKEGGAPLMTAITSVPFSIGRDDAADLCIDSRRVSRRHAVINCEGGVYSIDDLDSTNGTFVNGERISDAKLQSGDVLVFGDAEFTFNAPQAERASCMVTQLMDPASWREPEGAADDTIYLVRRMHAMLMNRCLRVRFEPIVRFDSAGLFGHEMIDGLSAAPSHRAAEQRRLMQIDCQLTARLRQMQRMIAAEEAGDFSAGTHVFLPIAGSEIGSQRLIESLVDLSHVVSPNKRLVIVIPHDNVSNSAYLDQFYDQTRELGLGMAYGECAGGHVAGEGKEANRPDFVKLARALTRGIHRASERQKRVEAIVRDARNAGCQIIAAGISCEEEAVCCRELGCHFGQGSFCTEPADASPIPNTNDQAVHA
jgi:EAL domain-containing protein (putative c-di-GMP-specific phosphodiesterase class I)